LAAFVAIRPKNGSTTFLDSWRESEAMQFTFWITDEETARHFWSTFDSTFLDDSLPPRAVLRIVVPGGAADGGAARQRTATHSIRRRPKNNGGKDVHSTAMVASY
jgi:hypothetical protein